jgi:hypothetical protein
VQAVVINPQAIRECDAKSHEKANIVVGVLTGSIVPLSKSHSGHDERSVLTAEPKAIGHSGFKRQLT